jgi:hypothetical protein
MKKDIDVVKWQPCCGYMHQSFLEKCPYDEKYVAKVRQESLKEFYKIATKREWKQFLKNTKLT